MARLEEWLTVGVVFQSSEALFLFNNIGTLHQALSRDTEKGLLARVRRDTYAVLDPATGEPYANKFQIASSLSEDAVISHVTAFQYHGLYNQVSNEVIYTSRKKKRTFYFEGNEYRAILPRLKEPTFGVIEPRWDKIRVTDIERSVLDSVYDLGKVAGIEELLEIFEILPSLSEEKITYYLTAYSNKSFYQRLGYLLENYSNQNLSKSFYTSLIEKIGSTKSYLLPKDERQLGKETYNTKWHLMVPSLIAKRRMKGLEVDEAK